MSGTLKSGAEGVSVEDEGVTDLPQVSSRLAVRHVAAGVANGLGIRERTGARRPLDPSASRARSQCSGIRCRLETASRSASCGGRYRGRRRLCDRRIAPSAYFSASLAMRGKSADGSFLEYGDSIGPGGLDREPEIQEIQPPVTRV